MLAEGSAPMGPRTERVEALSAVRVAINGEKEKIMFNLQQAIEHANAEYDFSSMKEAGQERQQQELEEEKLSIELNCLDMVNKAGLPEVAKILATHLGILNDYLKCKD